MIAVLADDLSGAAELAGVALQHGLTAEVQTVFHPATNADVVCLDTNTRLLPETKAATLVAETARTVLAARPAWIYKKCDSVLRGPVLAEARSIARALGQKHILLLPANPSRQRVIRDGVCFVGHQPLHETVFARDPLHPRTSSRVGELLGGDLTGITLPDSLTHSDLLRHAATVDPHTLPVGAADFFTALLELRVPRKTVAATMSPTPGPTLLVCGSAATWLKRQTEAELRGIPVCTLVHDHATMLAALRSAGLLLLGIGDIPVANDQGPVAHTARLAQNLCAILHETRVARLMIEGGATASAMLQALSWPRLKAVDSFGEIAVLRPAEASGPDLFIKPGSYAWPAKLWPGN